VPELCAGSDADRDKQREQVNDENVDQRDGTVNSLVHFEICLPQGRLRPHAFAVRDLNISDSVRGLP
jgi:hypothetical protein